MTPLLILFTGFSAFTVASFAVYITSDPDEQHDNIFWKYGRFYDAFFFNHGQPTADREKPAEEEDKLEKLSHNAFVSE